MKYLIFILLISTSAFLYFYYNRKLDLLKKQLMLVRSKHYISKNTYSNTENNLNNITIKFSIPIYNRGSVKANSKLYLSPLLNSNILKEINSTMEISILDCAEINNETWFYINTPSNNNINSRGWINSNDISIFYSNTSSLDKTNNVKS